jgi:hypothetical protein
VFARAKLAQRARQLAAVGLGSARGLAENVFGSGVARNCFTCASTLWPSVETRA